MIISGQILEFEVSIEPYQGVHFDTGNLYDITNPWFILDTKI